MKLSNDNWCKTDAEKYILKFLKLNFFKNIHEPLKRQIQKIRKIVFVQKGDLYQNQKSETRLVENCRRSAQSHIVNVK